MKKLLCLVVVLVCGGLPHLVEGQDTIPTNPTSPYEGIKPEDCLSKILPNESIGNLGANEYLSQLVDNTVDAAQLAILSTDMPYDQKIAACDKLSGLKNQMRKAVEDIKNSPKTLADNVQNGFDASVNKLESTAFLRNTTFITCEIISLIPTDCARVAGPPGYALAAALGALQGAVEAYGQGIAKGKSSKEIVSDMKKGAAIGVVAGPALRAVGNGVKLATLANDSKTVAKEIAQKEKNLKQAESVLDGLKKELDELKKSLSGLKSNKKIAKINRKIDRIQSRINLQEVEIGFIKDELKELGEKQARVLKDSEKLLNDLFNDIVRGDFLKEELFKKWNVNNEVIKKIVNQIISKFVDDSVSAGYDVISDWLKNLDIDSFFNGEIFQNIISKFFDGQSDLHPVSPNPTDPMPNPECPNPNPVSPDSEDPAPNPECPNPIDPASDPVCPNPNPECPNPIDPASNPVCPNPNPECPNPIDPAPNPVCPNPNPESPTSNPEYQNPNLENPETSMDIDIDKILQEYFPELYPDNPNPSPEPKPTPPTPSNPNTPTVDNPNGGNQQGGQGSGGTKVNPLDPTYDPWGDVWDAMPDAVGDVCEKVLSEAEGYVGKQLDKLIAKYPGLQNVLNHIGIDGTGLVRGVVNIVGVLITAPDIGTAIGQLMDMAVNSLKQIATRLIQWGVQWLAEKLLGNLLVPQAVQWIEKTASNWLIGVATPVIDAGLDALRTQIEKCARCAGFKVAPTPPSPTTTKFVNGLINGNSGAGSNSSTFKSK